MENRLERLSGRGIVRLEGFVRFGRGFTRDPMLSCQGHVGRSGVSRIRVAGEGLACGCDYASSRASAASFTFASSSVVMPLSRGSAGPVSPIPASLTAS